MYVWLLQRMSVVDFTFGGIVNPVAGIATGMVLMGESFTPVQYSLMTGMIVMSLLPQLISVIRQSKIAQSGYAVKNLDYDFICPPSAGFVLLASHLCEISILF